MDRGLKSYRSMLFYHMLTPIYFSYKLVYAK